jgi:4-hydroxy-3-polyprenylbenzoate decarboxylase
MVYKNLEACLNHLNATGQLVRIKQEVDPNLEMAAIHLRVHEAGGKAILFEKVKGSKYRAASNIFGTLERSKFIFKDTFTSVQQLIEVKNNPMAAFKKPLQLLSTAASALNALPLKNPLSTPVLFSQINITDIPLIKHWPMDGGAFVTLPQVYSEDIDKPGIMNANLGMYRIQLNGNNYVTNQEIGLHYQLHRGIGVHQGKANQKGQPLKVSIFVGGPPAHTVAAVMPLPEGLSEMTFAGVLGNRRFRYVYKDGFCLSTDADFVITGYVYPNENKPEGPFGDHLGYYSLQHDFPLMRVHKVVGRPPQEDTSFGNLIHALTGDALKHELPGVKEIHAVDAAGVHPLLLAIGSERYTPYNQTKQPAELLTIANHILGTGQLSLAKFLFITASENQNISTHAEQAFFAYILERINLQRDLHFYTNTTIDTLDYSGEGLNTGSKVVIAAYGAPLRTLGTQVPNFLQNAFVVMPGVLAITQPAFVNYQNAAQQMQNLTQHLQQNAQSLTAFPLIIIADDAAFVAQNLLNFLWVSFTRCNPSHDMYGVNPTTVNKHWGCDNLIIDARKKPHHAPELVKDAAVEKRVDEILSNVNYQ